MVRVVPCRHGCLSGVNHPRAWGATPGGILRFPSGSGRPGCLSMDAVRASARAVARQRRLGPTGATRGLNRFGAVPRHSTACQLRFTFCKPELTLHPPRRWPNRRRAPAQAHEDSGPGPPTTLPRYSPAYPTRIVSPRIAVRATLVGPSRTPARSLGGLTWLRRDHARDLQ